MLSVAVIYIILSQISFRWLLSSLTPGVTGDESVVGHNCKLEDYISVIQATLTNARAFEEQKKAKQSLLPKNDDKKQSQNQTRSGYSRGSGRNTMSSFQTGSGGRKTDPKSLFF